MAFLKTMVNDAPERLIAIGRLLPLPSSET
jgi:hypothetical protein